MDDSKVMERAIGSFLLFQRTQEPRGVSCINARFRDVFCNHATGADQHVVANVHWQHGNITSDENTISHAGWFPEVLPSERRPAIGGDIVHKHHTMTDKAIVTDRHQFTHKSVGLDSGPFADHDAALDFHKRTDKAV